MKLFKLAAILLALSSAALSQVTLTCPHCALGPLSYSATLNTDSVSNGVILNNTALSAVPLSWSIAGPGFLPGGGFTCKSGTANRGSCTISVKFHPTVAGKVAGTLTINAGTPTVTTVVPLAGTAATPATKFKIGDRIVVLPGNVAVRATPSSTGVLLGVQQPGALGTVIGGPVFDPTDAYTRWNVNYDSGPDGWSIEPFIGPSSIPAPVAKTVQLTWFAPLSDGAAIYNLYRSSGSGGLVKIGNVVGSLLTFTDQPVSSGTYNYVATTVNSSGVESAHSNQVTVVIP